MATIYGQEPKLAWLPPIILAWPGYFIGIPHWLGLSGDTVGAVQGKEKGVVGGIHEIGELVVLGGGVAVADKDGVTVTVGRFGTPPSDETGKNCPRNPIRETLEPRLPWAQNTAIIELVVEVKNVKSALSARSTERKRIYWRNNL